MKSSLIDAINNVPKEYYQTINPECRDGKKVNYSRRSVDLEQKFVLELYHQLRKLTDGESFILEGEIQKRIVHKDYGKDESIKKEIEKYHISRVKPDLIFHKGQEFNSSIDQKLVLECKFGETNDNHFNKDLVKMMLYDLNLNFQNCIFLIVKQSLDSIKKQITKFKANHYIIENTDKIHILVKEDFGKKIEELKIK